MLPKKHKLTGFEVAAVLKNGKKISFDGMRGVFLPTANLPMKFAVIIPSRLKLPAFQRNRLKRRLYEAIRQCAIKQDQAEWIVFMVKDKRWLELKWPELKTALKNNLTTLFKLT